MKDRKCTIHNSYHVDKPEPLAKEMDRIREVLDAKYQPADLKKIVSECDNLDPIQQDKLLDLLNKHQKLFDGSSGQLQAKSYDIKLKENATPYHANPFPIPHVHEAKLRAEVQHLVELGILTKVNNSNWGAPTWAVSYTHLTLPTKA